MIVYGDLLFLINFSMDFLCFYISCMLLHKRLPTLRACVASVIGGAYSVAALFITSDGVLAFVLDIFVLIVMCLMVYLEKGVSIGRLIKATFLYFFVSALLGGLMTALFSIFNRVEIFAGELGIEEGIDVWIFALLAAVGSAVTLWGGRIFRSSTSKRTVTLEISGEAGSAHLYALVDSGNLAVEPISGKAVVFAELEACSTVLTNALYLALADGVDVSALPFSVASGVRLVPTKTVGGGALLPAVRMKSVKLVSGKREKELDVYLALVKGKISDTHNAIISSEAIN